MCTIRTRKKFMEFLCPDLRVKSFMSQKIQKPQVYVVVVNLFTYMDIKTPKIVNLVMPSCFTIFAVLTIFKTSLGILSNNCSKPLKSSLTWYEIFASHSFTQMSMSCLVITGRSFVLKYQQTRFEQVSYYATSFLLFY